MNSSSDDSDSSDTNILTPPNINEAARSVVNNLLPQKSREKYLKVYDNFVLWQTHEKTKSFSENVMLAYFDKLSKTLKPSTLWGIYSMLKATIDTKHNINIKHYTKLTMLLKRLSTGYKPKKSRVLTAENVETFLREAPDEIHLAIKVILIFGINGACRSIELTNIKTSDMEDHRDLLLVNLVNTKTRIDRSFVIRDDFLNIVRKYQMLRPSDIPHDRFFLNYINGRCTKQPIGRHKLAAVPKTIAAFLSLPNAESYTGHCFRRTSATLLADAGANLTTLKRHGGWKSSKVAESYIEDSVKNKSKVNNQITKPINLHPSTPTVATTSRSGARMKPPSPIPSTSIKNDPMSKTTELNQTTATTSCKPPSPLHSSSHENGFVGSMPTQLSRSELHSPFPLHSTSFKNVSVQSMPTELSQTTTINVPGKNISLTFNNCVCHINMN